MLTLVLCALAHGGKAFAGETAELGDPLLAPKPVRPQLPALAMPADSKDSPGVISRPSEDDFSATEFRPRRRASTVRATADYGGSDPMFRTTTVWQRLNEFRAQDRVRVLTLWEMGGSNVSLQAGKKGDPSLQWSSSWTSQSRASHGLLDRLLSASLNGMISRASSARYAPGAASAAKPVNTTAVIPAK